MNKEMNKFLTEAVGECCPKFYDTYGYHNCIDFLTWEGFGKLWTWAKGQEWWDGFIKAQIFGKRVEYGGHDKGKWNIFPTADVDPERFAKAVADFLQKK